MIIAALWFDNADDGPNKPGWTITLQSKLANKDGANPRIAVPNASRSGNQGLELGHQTARHELARVHECLKKHMA